MPRCTPRKVGICIHCRRCAAPLNRGLCYACYYKTPGVREMYPATPAKVSGAMGAATRMERLKRKRKAA